VSTDFYRRGNCDPSLRDSAQTFENDGRLADCERRPRGDGSAADLGAVFGHGETFDAEAAERGNNLDDL